MFKVYSHTVLLKHVSRKINNRSGNTYNRKAGFMICVRNILLLPVETIQNTHNFRLTSLKKRISVPPVDITGFNSIFLKYRK
jgi:hypothetical protein